MMQPIQKIAVPIDFSSFSEAAASYAAVLAKFFNAAIVLIHVVDQRGVETVRRFGGGSGAFDGERLEKERLADCMKRLSSMASQLEKHGFQVETHVRVDIPFRGILKCAAQTGSNLLVLAAKGRTGLADVLVGSCAEKLFRRSPVPVMIIPAVFVQRHESVMGTRTKRRCLICQQK